MDNNRLTITHNKSKRKIINNLLTIIIIILLIVVSILLLFKDDKKEEKNTSTTTTSTTTTTEVITTTTSVVNNYTNVFVYNYVLRDNNYKVFVCNGESYARISNYTLLNNNKVLGDSTSVDGVILDKNSIDLTNKKSLSLEINDKKYMIKYNNKCN